MTIKYKHNNPCRFDNIRQHFSLFFRISTLQVKKKKNVTSD